MSRNTSTITSPDIRSCGPVVMSRQNLGAGRPHPWVAHGCLEGAAGFATDAMQLLGPAYRDAAGFAGASAQTCRRAAAARGRLPAIRSRAVRRWRRARAAAWTSSASSCPTTPRPPATPTSRALDAASRPLADLRAAAGGRRAPRARSLLQDAPPLAGASRSTPPRSTPIRSAAHEEERRDGRLLSFFVPDGAHNRHVVLARQGADASPGATGRCCAAARACCSTRRRSARPCWMHGVFAALAHHRQHLVPQAVLGRRATPTTSPAPSGLRILVETGGGWRLLAVPSAFEIGLSDCRWIYRLDDRTVTVQAVASGDDPAMQWRVDRRGRALPLPRLRPGWFSASASSSMPAASRSMPTRKRIAFRPDPDWLWGQRYPDAVYHLVTAHPEAVEAIGGDELLYADGKRARRRPIVALRTRPTTSFASPSSAR